MHIFEITSLSRRSILNRRGPAAGEPGEFVFTTITKEAFPLIRYRTGTSPT